MGRKKGTKLTDEQKANMKAGRAAAKAKRMAIAMSGDSSSEFDASSKPKIRPVVEITGKENDAFDFSTPIRKAMRTAGMNRECDMLIARIRDPMWWKNVDKVKEIINEVCTVRVMLSDTSKVKKARKKHEYTPEERQRMLERMATARAARSK